jgi:hypothetical protein
MRLAVLVVILLTSQFILFSTSGLNQIEDMEEYLYSSNSRSTDDNDEDGVENWNDECPDGVSNWISNNYSDYDADGCKDRVSVWGLVNHMSVQDPIYYEGYVYQKFSIWNQSGQYDIFIAKFDFQDNLIWNLTIPYLGNGYGINLEGFDSVGNMYLVGSFGNSEVTFGNDILNGSNNYGADTLIVKVSTSGEYLWANTIGGGHINKITFDSNGSSYVCGSYAHAQGYVWDNPPNEYGLVAKIAADGELIWENGLVTIGITCNDLTADNSDDLYIVGKFSGQGIFGEYSINETVGGSCPSGYCDDAFVAKIQSNGQWQWAKGVGSGEHDEATVVETLGDGKVIVGGVASYEMQFGDYNLSIIYGEPQYPESQKGGFLATIDQNGSWVSAEGYHWTFIRDIMYIGDESLIISGYYYNGGTLGPHLTNWTAFGFFNGYVGEYNVGTMNYTWGIEKPHSSGCSSMWYCSTSINRVELFNSTHGIASGWNGTNSFLVSFDLVANMEDQDDDNDSILDQFDLCQVGELNWISELNSDYDGDGCRDFDEDFDDDGDGYADNIDAFPLNSSEWSDFDMDGIGDNSDEDDDNDGYIDIIDQFPFDSTDWSDFDEDGIGDNSDQDDDNDGWIDTLDIWPYNSSEWSDEDGDGMGDNADDDDDNDGILDIYDACPIDSSGYIDADEDGICNESDPDDDNDGWMDLEDIFPLDPNEWIDTDEDGFGNNFDLDDDGDEIYDVVDAFPLDPSESSDRDGDGIGDNLDGDDDGDGWSDDNELECSSDPMDKFSVPTDTDSDNICNVIDNDDDGDGIEDDIDRFPLDASEWLDTDGDGVGDNEDAFPSSPYEYLDTDSDGIGDFIDAFPYNSLESIDTDGDGIGDNTDNDDDNDSWLDLAENNCGTNPKDFSDRPADMDNDRQCDILDSDKDGDGYENNYELICNSDSNDISIIPKDLDEDGICDINDSDIDGDGVSNIIEKFTFTDSRNPDSRITKDLLFSLLKSSILFVSLVSLLVLTYKRRDRVGEILIEGAQNFKQSSPHPEMIGVKKGKNEWLVYDDRVWSRNTTKFGKFPEWKIDTSILVPDRRMIGVIDDDGREYLFKYDVLWIRSDSGTWTLNLPNYLP